MAAEKPTQIKMAMADIESGQREECPGRQQSEYEGRDFIWDNLKGLCVLLVVLIHTLRVFEQEVVTEGHFASGIILPLVYVCMPAFCFASGHLSSVANTRRRRESLFRMWAVFLIQQALYALYWFLQTPPLTNIGRETFAFWRQPIPGVTWFILCLAGWRTMLPLLDLLRHPVAASIVLATVSQVTDTTGSEYLRPFLAFLPFFASGYSTPKGFLQVRTYTLAKRCFLILLVVCPTASLLLPLVPGGVGVFDTVSKMTWTGNGCLYGGRIADGLREQSIACHSETGVALSLSFYAISMALIPGFLSLVPTRMVWGLTRAGAMSVYIYLMHIYFLVSGKKYLANFLVSYGRGNFFQDTLLASAWAVPACVVLAITLWGCLACGWIRPICMPLVEPNVELIFAPSDAASNGEKTT